MLEFSLVVIRFQSKVYSYSTSTLLLGTWHFERKRAVLKAHPEVQQLNGQTPLTAVLLVAMFTYIS